MSRSRFIAGADARQPSAGAVCALHRAGRKQRGVRAAEQRKRRLHTGYAMFSVALSAPLRYLGIEVDDALEIAEQTGA